MSAQPKSGDEHRVGKVLIEVRSELLNAIREFPPFNSPHEGKAVIEEELDELWAHVKANTGRSDAAYREAIQVAAMALRYAVDLFGYRSPAPLPGGDER